MDNTTLRDNDQYTLLVVDAKDHNYEIISKRWGHVEYKGNVEHLAVEAYLQMTMQLEAVEKWEADRDAEGAQEEIPEDGAKVIQIPSKKH